MLFKKLNKQTNPFTIALSQWDFSHAKFGLLSPGKPAATESCYLTYDAR